MAMDSSGEDVSLTLGSLGLRTRDLALGANAFSRAMTAWSARFGRRGGTSFRAASTRRAGASSRTTVSSNAGAASCAGRRENLSAALAALIKATAHSAAHIRLIRKSPSSCYPMLLTHISMQGFGVQRGVKRLIDSPGEDIGDDGVGTRG